MEAVVSGLVPASGLAEQRQALKDAAATRSLGRWLAAALLPGTARDSACRQPGIADSAAEAGTSPAPALLLLEGELGAGKTCLVQGLAEALGIDEPITSPTFALAQHYSGLLPDGSVTRLVHLDLYRLDHPAAADELFAQEEEEALAAAATARVVMAVEWPERLSLLPAGAWQLQLERRGDGRRARWRRPGPAAH